MVLHMSRASETDLLTRSRSGDYRSRVDLYRKFIHGNASVRRHGAHYSHLDDFLQDCFANLLRSGDIVSGERGLTEAVEQIAAATALERDRSRAIDLAAQGRQVRLCAAIEDDGPGNLLSSYVPPCSGTADSLHSRMAAVCGEAQFKMLRAQSMENAGWERLAAIAPKPAAAAGATFARAVERLSRLFGAPPPLNQDFEPVFSDVSASDARARRSDPGKPRGRVIAMQLDPEFYVVTPELRKVGVSMPADARTIRLWDAARSSEAPDEALRTHLAKCRYCTDLFRSLLLVHQAVCMPDRADFLLCPAASTVLMDSDDLSDSCRNHLDACVLCRNERNEAFGLEELAAHEPETGALRAAKKKVVLWSAVALILAAGVVIALMHRSPAPPQTTSAVSAPAQPAVFPDPKYRSLLKQAQLDATKLLPSFHQSNQLVMMEAMGDLGRGDSVHAKIISERVSNLTNDPGARTLLAVCLFGEQRSADGYREMQTAEATPPRNVYRCWLLLQCALLEGDTAIAEREIGHLAGDPEYGPRVKDLQSRMQAIK